MSKILLERIEKLETRIINEKTFLNEMKKIGIEKLPYAYSAVDRFINKETMDVHYNKHYKGYVDKLNKSISKRRGGDKELEEIVKDISKYNKKIRDNAGGAFNHALFWKMLSPEQQKCSGDIYDKITIDFGSYRDFKSKFEEVAKKRFGSGWAWLVLDRNNKLKVISTPNQDNPLMDVVKGGGYPLLGLDLWEHAYYLKYLNKRDDYIKNFWTVINWKFVNKLLKSRLSNN